MGKYISKKVLWTIVMLLAIALFLVACVHLCVYEDPAHTPVGKPVIYLYPETETDVSVRLGFNGKLGLTYPAYGDGWRVTAYPDGRLIDQADGSEYGYLFWEGDGNFSCDMSTGFVVAGGDTIGFLREKLAYMGLLPKEYNDFIVYWAPLMQSNAYNLISFQGDAYTDAAKLEVSPAPDSVLRIFMAFKPLDKPVNVPEQELETFQRTGFAVVEWGGAEVE